jgi:hypothetical protein
MGRGGTPKSMQETVKCNVECTDRSQTTTQSSFSRLPCHSKSLPRKWARPQTRATLAGSRPNTRTMVLRANLLALILAGWLFCQAQVGGLAARSHGVKRSSPQVLRTRGALRIRGNLRATLSIKIPWEFVKAIRRIQVLECLSTFGRHLWRCAAGRRVGADSKRRQAAHAYTFRSQGVTGTCSLHACSWLGACRGACARSLSLCQQHLHSAHWLCARASSGAWLPPPTRYSSGPGFSLLTHGQGGLPTGEAQGPYSHSSWQYVDQVPTGQPSPTTTKSSSTAECSQNSTYRAALYVEGACNVDECSQDALNPTRAAL